MKLTIERAALLKAAEMSKSDLAQWQKLPARGKKLETALRSARIRKPSHVYHLVSAASPEEVLFLLYHSALRPVQERLRNHFQKYLPAIQEITAEEWSQVEGSPGSPRYQKARQEFIARRLDRRPPKPAAPPGAPGSEASAPPAPEPAPPAAPTRGSGWRAQPGTAARRVRASHGWGQS